MSKQRKIVNKRIQDNTEKLTQLKIYINEKPPKTKDDYLYTSLERNYQTKEENVIMKEKAKRKAMKRSIQIEELESFRNKVDEQLEELAEKNRQRRLEEIEEWKSKIALPDYHFPVIEETDKDIKQKELEIQKDTNEKKDTKGKEKDLNELKERLTKSLSEAQSRIKPLATSKYYSTISKLYSALLKKNTGDQKGFEEDINKIDFNNYKNESNEQSRFYKELASIIIAKAYLDDETKISNAKELLTNLIKDGKYFNVVAFNTLSIIAKGEEEEELKKLKEELLSKAPEQSELLKN